MNPFITMATFMTGLCTLPRALYYIVGQLIGALAGGFFLKLGLGGSKYFFPDVRSTICSSAATGGGVTTCARWAPP